MGQIHNWSVIDITTYNLKQDNYISFQELKNSMHILVLDRPTLYAMNDKFSPFRKPNKTTGSNTNIRKNKNYKQAYTSTRAQSIIYNTHWKDISNAKGCDMERLYLYIYMTEYLRGQHVLVMTTPCLIKMHT